MQVAVDLNSYCDDPVRQEDLVACLRQKGHIHILCEASRTQPFALSFALLPFVSYVLWPLIVVPTSLHSTDQALRRP